MRSRMWWMVALGVVGLLSTADPAQSCPMCRENVASNPALPQAYMYSILFMLSMPALVLSGFGFTIWRAFQKHDQQQQALQSLEQTLAETELESRPQSPSA